MQSDTHPQQGRPETSRSPRSISAHTAPSRAAVGTIASLAAPPCHLIVVDSGTHVASDRPFHSVLHIVVRTARLGKLSGAPRGPTALILALICDTATQAL